MYIFMPYYYHHHHHHHHQETSVKRLLRAKLDILFEDEEGVDGGGLTREWYALLMREIFRPSYALFLPTSNGVTFTFNPNSGVNPEHLEYFRFVGLVIGKAVVDGQLLDAHISRPIYNHIYVYVFFKLIN
jgi:E3 ubiquitin-protein ligase HUWE1